MDPKLLKPHLQNWRVHDKRQREAYHALREQLGNQVWLIPVIYNEKTDRLLDGHMRVEEAIKDGEKSIPVRIVRFNANVDRIILASFDTVGDMAKADPNALEALLHDTRDILRSVKTRTNKTLAQMLKDASGHKFGIKRSPSVRVKVKDDESDDPNRETGEYIPNEYQSIVEETLVNNDVKFSSSNEWEIPDPLPERLATPDMLPVDTWYKGTKSEDLLYYCHGQRPWNNHYPGKGVLGFYTDDYRFERVFSDADDFCEVLKGESWTALIAPDFSAYKDWPFPEQLYNIYRSRWCMRLWQEQGHFVIPTLEDIGTRTESVIYSTLGKVSCCAIQTRNAKNDESIISQVKSAVSALRPEAMLLYGGANREKYIRPYLPRKVEYLFLEDTIRVKRRRTPNDSAD